MDRGKGYNRRARKLLHIAGGIPALLLPLLPYWLWVAGTAALLALVFWLRPNHARWLRAITKPIDRKRGVISGVRGYFSAVLALLLLWPLLNMAGLPQAERYIIFGWLALALGDGLAGIVGPGPSRGHTVPWNKQKTWWGVAGCFIGTLLAFALAFGLSYPNLHSPPFTTGLLLAAVASSVLVALMESADLPADDNYTVGLGAPVIALLCVKLFSLPISF